MTKMARPYRHAEEMKKKGLSQGSYGSFVPSLLNDSPFFDDSIAEEKTDVKDESSDKLFSRSEQNKII